MSGVGRMRAKLARRLTRSDAQMYACAGDCTCRAASKEPALGRARIKAELAALREARWIALEAVELGAATRCSG
jgi:hypothetical protein